MERVTQYEINRRTVQEGLKRRNDRMDAYEQDMITACNKNCADARKRREREEIRHTAQVVSEEERKARARERLQTMQANHRKDQKANRAVTVYLYVITALMLLTCAARFPFWATITTALGLAVCLMCYLYRVFVPFKDPKEVA